MLIKYIQSIEDVARFSPLPFLFALSFLSKITYLVSYFQSIIPLEKLASSST